jgi:hypothetical protein
MIQSRLRQIARLEKLAEPYLKHIRQVEKEVEQIYVGAAAHAAIIAFLVRYGEPRLTEPLSSACQRVTESDAWQTCRGKYFSESIRPGPFVPYNRDEASIIGMPLRHMVISNFRGINEKEKLNAIFSSAPPWLIWHTFGDYTAELLGLKAPNLSQVRSFARSKENFKVWYGVPPGAFECRDWPDGPEGEPLAAVNLRLLIPETRNPQKQGMTTRERRREHPDQARTPGTSWPHLLPSEFLELPFNEQLSFIERLRAKLTVTLEG